MARDAFIFLWLMLAALGTPLGIRLHAAEAPASTTPVIRSYDQFWQLGQSGISAECPMRARFFVMVYYPEWKALWVIWEGQIRYLDGGSGPLPLHAGQWVDMDGYARPATQKIVWAKTRFTPVAGLSAPEPVRLHDNLDNLDDASSRSAEVDGVVDEQVDLDAHHIRLNLVFGGANATVFVQIDGVDAVPQLVGTLVRAKGVLSQKRDLGEVAPKLELWCQALGSIDTVEFLARDPRFAVAATPIDAVLQPTAGKIVRVSGIVHGQDPGHSVMLRDETGQITVQTRQLQPVRDGEPVEAIGRPERSGVEVILRDGLFRRVVATPRVAEIQYLLRLAEQVRTLSPAEVARGFEARISGVVTWSSPTSSYLFVEDATGGLKVRLPQHQAGPPPPVGTGVIVRGPVFAGEFVPGIAAITLLPGENVALRDPQIISLERAMTGGEYGGWVEMQGYVRSVTHAPDECRLELTAPSGEFTAVLPPEVGGDLTGALIRVRGVCDAIANGRRQLTGIRLLAPGAEWVSVVEAAPRDPFATPMESIGNLMRYNPTTPLNRRVQVTGVVLLHLPGRLVYVEDGSDTLTVLSRQLERLSPGDRITIVGIPGQDGGRLIMRDAVYRKLSRGTPPRPLRLDDVLPNTEMDGRLVRVTGSLLSNEPAADGWRFQLQHASRIFTARLDGADLHRGALAVGSVLQLTGVYRVELDEYRRPRAVVIQLQSPADIVEVSRPTWWTTQRVLWMAATLLALVVLAMGWGVMLSRKNEQLQRADRELRRANEELEVRVTARTHDLTEEVEQRRRSEETLAAERMLLRTLIDNLPVYLYVKDASGRFVIGNLPHAQLLGATSCADVIGKTERDFWPADIAQARAESDRLVTDSGAPLILREEPYAIGDRRGWHATTKVPLRDASGNVTGLIAIMQDVTARKESEAERENLHRQLVETSRHAGMAEVATGVLHNIGNVLNSVNISVGVAAGIIGRSRLQKLGVLTDLLGKHRGDLAAFFAHDPRAHRIPEYLEAISEQLRNEHAEVAKELTSLQSNIDHIKQVVAMQQTYAKIAGVTEKISVQDVIDDALRINAEGLARHHVQVVRDMRANPTIVVERHKVLQILVNLISNAKYACSDRGGEGKQITVTVTASPEAVQIAVTDNGVGIPKENLTRIFSHGFTTRKNGHGFGLHSGALAAKELGGALRVGSDGLGCGATFTLEIPAAPAASDAQAVDGRRSAA